MERVMQKTDSIFIAGHRGLVGSALVRCLQAKGYENLLLSARSELDLTDAKAVSFFFQKNKPRYVFLAAAKVGGIHANNTYPVDFLEQNLLIQTNVIKAAYQNGIQRLLFLGSSCIYPKHCSQPMKEEYLLTGPLEPTNRPYALAKISGIELCHAYNRQYGTQYLAAMPTNLYGPGDNYHPDNSHVIPGMIRRFHEAKISGAKSVCIWGTGTPYREFLYSDDLADACVFLMEQPESVFKRLCHSSQDFPLINIGSGQEVTIAQLAKLVADVVDFKGEIVFDTSKPDGTPRKLLDSSSLEQLGWKPLKGILEGLDHAYSDFLNQS